MSFVIRPKMSPNRPSRSSDNVARLPPAVGSTSWRPVTRRPGATLTQVKLLPGSIDVIFQNAGGNFG